jgi:transposase-like protein
MTLARTFRGFRFPAEVILWAVRWYLRFPVSYRDLGAMLADRGVERGQEREWARRGRTGAAVRGDSPFRALKSSRRARR